MNWKRENKKERRKVRGERRDRHGRVMPPSMGKRYMVLTEEHRFGFDRLIDLIEEEPNRIRIVRKNEHWTPRHMSELDYLKRAWRHHPAILVKRGFPDSYLLEIDDDDTLEITIKLMF